VTTTVASLGVAEIESLVDHLEKHLGRIDAGWSVDPDGERMPFQVVKFSRGSDLESVAYSTLGLSPHVLRSPRSGRAIRQELMMLAPLAPQHDVVVSLLLQVGAMALANDRALLRGEVIGPAGPIAEGSRLTSFYVGSPVYFPDEFATYAGPAGEVVVAWLVPVSDAEAGLVARAGWEALENEFVLRDPDLVDFHRPPMQV
jgi:hypothetical protein